MREAIFSALEARDAIAAPFAQVHGALAALDLQAVQATLEETIGSVASAVSSAPIEPRPESNAPSGAPALSRNWTATTDQLLIRCTAIGVTRATMLPTMGSLGRPLNRAILAGPRRPSGRYRG